MPERAIMNERHFDFALKNASITIKERFLAFAIGAMAISLRKAKLKFRKKGNFRQAKAMVIKMKEFNPIDKVSELTEMLKEYNPIIHQSSDEGYDWLDENSFCIELPNPNTDDSITIECEDCGEFTVCYSYFHSHHFADEYGYNRMCEQLSDLLNSKCGSAAIFCGNENKWMGSTTIEKDKTSLPLEEIFHFIFEHKEFAEKLRTNGGEARFVFWDSGLNKTIKF